MNYLLQENI